MEKQKNKNLGLIILFVCIFAIGFVSGRVFQKSGGSITSVITGDSTADFDLFWSVWDIMKSQYVDSSKADETQMLYGSIKGMVNSFDDPATVFLDPSETDEFNNSSEGKYFEGIGAELGYNNGSVIVVAPLEGSPAKAAGIRAGDYILAVDGVELTSDDSVYDVVAKIRGESGTQVTLTILHSGETESQDITITRSEITVASMELSYVGDNDSIAYLQVNRFTESSYNEWVNVWDENIDKIVASGVSKMILDLRGNPGGYLDAAVYAADDFLDEGKTIVQQQDSDGNIQKTESEKGGKLTNIQLVVLVDSGSASASEILAGALQQSERATVIGTKTYGKGTAQSVLDLPDGSSLHVTILKWLLPDSAWLNKDNPITPDIEVEYTDTDFTNGTDPQLNKALTELQN